jgi:hypothetical protein
MFKLENCHNATLFDQRELFEIQLMYTLVARLGLEWPKDWMLTGLECSSTNKFTDDLGNLSYS